MKEELQSLGQHINWDKRVMSISYNRLIVIDFSYHGFSLGKSFYVKFVLPSCSGCLVVIFAKSILFG